MVIAVMLVVAAVAAVMLRRNVAVSAAVQRQVDAYQVQHAVRGLQEGIEAWLTTQSPRDLPDVLDDDGFAFELDPRDGTRVLVYLTDGQGTARRSGVGVAEDIAPDVDAIAARLLQVQGVDNAQRFLREVGPYSVSLNAAPLEVLFAIADALAPEDKVQLMRDGFVRLVEDRRSQELGQTELNQLVSSANLTGADRNRMVRIFTTQPTLWEVSVLVRGDGVRVPLGLLARYRGLVLVEPAGTGTNAFENPSPFLMWEEVDLDDPRLTGQSAADPAMVGSRTGVGP
jgi:hypothetical protein